MYAPANLLRVFIEDHETHKLRAFQKFVHFPLAQGLILGGGNGLPSGKIYQVVYNAEENTMVGTMENVITPTDEGTIKYFLKYEWEEFNP